MLQILFEKQRKMWQTGMDKGGKMLQMNVKPRKSRRFLYKMKMLATFQFSTWHSPTFIITFCRMFIVMKSGLTEKGKITDEKLESGWAGAGI